MREIKFRAWSPQSNKMIQVSELFLHPTITSLRGKDKNDSSLYTYTATGNDGYDSHLQQYTGLKDENGTEVYEGDLFGVTNLNDELETVGEVIFDTDLAQFTIKYTNGGWAELWQHLSERGNKAKEVVGNIYENPELLK